MVADFYRRADNRTLFEKYLDELSAMVIMSAFYIRAKHLRVEYNLFGHKNVNLRNDPQS